jgi:hypothetical protein
MLFTSLIYDSSTNRWPRAGWRPSKSQSASPKSSQIHTQVKVKAKPVPSRCPPTTVPGPLLSCCCPHPPMVSSEATAEGDKEFRLWESMCICTVVPDLSQCMCCIRENVKLDSHYTITTWNN